MLSALGNLLTDFLHVVLQQFTNSLDELSPAVLQQVTNSLDEFPTVPRALKQTGECESWNVNSCTTIASMIHVLCGETGHHRVAYDVQLLSQTIDFRSSRVRE